MATVSSAQLDATFEELAAEARRRAPRRLSPRERRTAFALGGGFAAAATLVALFLPWKQPFSLGAALLLVVVYAAVSRVEFEVGAGFTVPTQLVVVPMLVLLPAPIVPLLVAGGLVLGDLAHVAWRIKHAERVLLAPSFAWHSVGPAIIVGLFADPAPNWGDWPVYVAALAAQFAVDGVVCTIDQLLAVPVAPRLLLPMFGWAWTIDGLLTPAALVAALSGSVAAAAALALSVAALLVFLARARTRSVERALELAGAYRHANAEARRDALTGLANRLSWEEALAAEDAAGPISLIVLDVDGLKRANDLRGHHFGDEVLRTVALTVRAAAPPDALVARIGGDEFGVLLRGADAEACSEAAAQLSRVLARHPGVDGFAVGATVGSAVRGPGQALQDTQRIADARMYERKRAA